LARSPIAAVINVTDEEDGSMRTRVWVIGSFIVLAAHFGVLSASWGAIVLKAGSTWEENLVFNEPLRVFADMVGKESKGEVTVKFIGGPETFPTFESIEVLRKGVIDLLNIGAPFYARALPAINVGNVSELTPEEERKSGYYDAINKLHQAQVNAFYLGRMADLQFGFVFKAPVQKADFARLKIRGLPLLNHLIESLGGSPIVIAPPELYSALEKGVVEGYGWPQIGHVERKLCEVAKYHIDHPFYRMAGLLVMNPDTWKKLSPNLQKTITEIMPQAERESCARHVDFLNAERAELEKQGVKFLRWPPDEVKKFYDVVRKAGIEEAQRLSPDHASELIKLLLK
jgi:TRAP-type transport system periplasmic protein